MTAANHSNYLAVERQRIICSVLQRKGSVRTTELMRLLRVSLGTIRADLRELEHAGYVERVWGGAVAKLPFIGERELFLKERASLHRAEKRRIGKYAAQLIQPGQTIIVDAGSTTVELIHHLPRTMDSLRVITNALNVAAAAALIAGVELVMTGGVLRRTTSALVGAEVIRALRREKADWVFLAANGVSFEAGLTASNVWEAEVKRTMAQRGARVVLLADSSKFGQRHSARVIGLDTLDMVITDTGLGDEDARALEAASLEVVRV